MTRHAPLVIALVAAGCSQPPPDNLVRASGHVEATETRLAPDAGGRILTFDLEEGDRVEAGQQILTLDRRDADLSLDGARAEEAQADAQLRLLLAGSRPEEIRQAESQVAAARADLSAARAELVSAEQDLERFEALLTTNSGSRKQRDDAATRRGVSADRVTAAESRVRSAEEALNRLKAGARQQEIDAARARLAASRVRIASLEKAIADTTLVSPVSGIVTEKLVEVGEIIAPRTPVAVLTDLDRAWADVFVPEPAIPRLRLGQEARLFTDAGGAPLTGTVSYVSPKAEFTPRNVQTADERSRLVYRVRVAVDNREGVLKLGMPVDAELALSPQ
jgi:HlyD family secretion protein